MKHTAIIADDHPIFRNGVRDVLEETGNFEVLGQGKDGIEAYNLIVAHRPDVAILDLEMPLLTGLDVCQKVLAEKHQTIFVLLTMHKERHYFNEAMKLGVRGYLLKDNAVVDLIQCLDAVVRGRMYVSPQIEQYLDDQAAHSMLNPQLQQQLALLSPTEKVILKLIAESKTSAEIAAMLFISPNTVDNHRSNIARKLNLEGKNSLIRFAMQHKGSV
jgi:DNA-binding NarL/FixJ family response regulator